jgi:eukaryotic-like serine/threonine-protein kinase
VPYLVSLDDAKKKFPEFTFLKPLTPSEQKCAFHVVHADGRHLCLKMISPAYEPERLSREIAALQLIAHPNVVRLHEYVYASKAGEQLHYIVEEYVDGDDLSAHLLGGKVWPRDRVVNFFAALFDGLAALTNAGVVHRDLKPANIRVRPDGSPVIVDFGVARHLGLPDITKTSIGAAVGTPAYFAPEQWDGSRRDIDHRTDIFAGGILLYQALLGRHPFLTSNLKVLSDLRDAVCSSDAPMRASDFLALPEQWRTLLGSALAKQRSKRIASAELVSRILRKLGAGT